MAFNELRPIRKCLRLPSGRAQKTLSQAGVKSDPAFCLGPKIQKTLSEMWYRSSISMQNEYISLCLSLVPLLAAGREQYEAREDPFTNN